MPNKPDWMTKKYSGTSLPDAFTGEVQDWMETVTWITHNCLLQVTDGVQGYMTIRLWMMAVGLLYRDIGIMKAQPNPNTEISARLRYWNIILERHMLLAFRRMTVMLRAERDVRDAKGPRPTTAIGLLADEDLSFSDADPDATAEEPTIVDEGSSTNNDHSLFMSEAQFHSTYPVTLVDMEVNFASRMDRIKHFCVTPGLMPLYEALAQYPVTPNQSLHR